MSGFFDTYQDIQGGGEWIDANQKQFLIENGVAFTIEKLVRDPENKFGDRWVAFMQVPNEKGEVEEKKLGFPVGTGVDTRDSMLGAMSEFLTDGGDPVAVKLDKPGRAILIVPADAE